MQMRYRGFAVTITQYVSFGLHVDGDIASNYTCEEKDCL